MKNCPECGGRRIVYSRTLSPFEYFLRFVLGFRVYKCTDCQWRGVGRPAKRKKNNASRIGLRTTLGIYALSAVVLLYLVFSVAGV